jgi:hypothetical protein
VLSDIVQQLLGFLVLACLLVVPGQASERSVGVGDDGPDTCDKQRVRQNVSPFI